MRQVARNIKNSARRVALKLKYGKRIEIGRGFVRRSGFKVVVEKNAKLTIGENVFFNNYCSVNCLKNIKIGDDCLFGENVRIYDHNHVFNKKSLVRENGYTYGEITIGKNCWIGSNVTILKKAKIGNNCVIGAGCVINEEIADNTIVTPGEKIVKRKINRQ